MNMYPRPETRVVPARGIRLPPSDGQVGCLGRLGRVCHDSVGGLAIFAFCAVVMILPTLGAEPGGDLAARQVIAGRLRITVGPNGLPEQIEIQAVPSDLPLEHRGKGAPAPTAETLAAMGRGPQLAAPMRLEATVAGKDVELTSATPVPLEQKDGTVLCQSNLAGAGIQAKLNAAYGPDGIMRFQFTWGGGTVDSLALVAKLPGLVDTVVAGYAPFKAAGYGIPEGEGLLWGNATPPNPPPKEPLPAVYRGDPGVPPHLFWGNGDRGFTWISEPADGWTVTPAAACMTLSRDQAGAVTWRALFVNEPGALKAGKPVAFTLRTHPAASPAADRRKVAWVAWPHAGTAPKVPPLKAAASDARLGLVRADCASVCEIRADAILLQGQAGGDARSAADTLADTYSLPLFRYLCGTHTGLPARLHTNSPSLTRPGRNPAPDRMAIGRALLHDVGFDPAGAAHLAMLGRVVSGLAQFGFFEVDDKMEFVPYWRSRSLLRYGEPFSKDDAFEITTTDPMERVHVSVWLRPGKDDRTRKALILIVNEGDKPVREQLYVLNAARLFGVANRITKVDVVDRWEMSAVPEDSDWAQKKLRGEMTGTTEMGVAGRGPNVPFLLDVEDGGGVAQSVAVQGQEVYHRVFIPARGFRLLLGGVP